MSGFTVIRNACLMGYPVVQSIKSVLPLVDEFVVGLGQSDDDSRSLIDSIGNPKIRILDTIWDTTKTKGGLILSEKTNEALDFCAHDWCFYIQADEVIHEEDYPHIISTLNAHHLHPDVQGILFDYIHFYGSYSTIATSRRWYRKEVRIVKKSTGIRSYNDAQGFRVRGQKPRVIESSSRIFHYGWVKPPKIMGQKSKLLNRWWHGNKRDREFDHFEYDRQYGLKRFEATHPEVMKSLVEKQDWSFDPRRGLSDWTAKDLNLLASDVIEKTFGYRIGEYRPYQIIKNEEKR